MEEDIDYLVTMLFTADQKFKGLIFIFIGVNAASVLLTGSLWNQRLGIDWLSLNFNRNHMTKYLIGYITSTGSAFSPGKVCISGLLSHSIHPSNTGNIA